MPRPPPIYSEFFWTPLSEDVEELLARFQQTDSVRYEVFSSIWRDMDFSDVFRGIPGATEMKRFCRVALATAVKYFLPPYSYQIQVGGLYLMHALYHTQLAVPQMKIRLALKDWHHVERFLRDSVNAQHYDVIYILKKLIATKAVHYTAMPHILTFCKHRKPRRDPVCAEFLGRTGRVQELVSADMLEEVSNIQSHYEELKDAVKEKEKSSLTAVVQRDFPSRLHDCGAEFVSWQQKNFPAEDQEEKSEDEERSEEAESSRRAQLLSSIKSKSYGNYQEASKSRRHRQVTAVETSSSGTENNQETSSVRRRRPPSLCQRTRKKLHVQEETSNLRTRLLSVPEQDRMTLKRTSQAAPFKG
ncbi:snRNA-activating protein complex subunit 1-like [Polymixia lowei]